MALKLAPSRHDFTPSNCKRMPLDLAKVVNFQMDDQDMNSKKDPKFTPSQKYHWIEKRIISLTAASNSLPLNPQPHCQPVEAPSLHFPSPVPVLLLCTSKKTILQLGKPRPEEKETGRASPVTCRTMMISYFTSATAKFIPRDDMAFPTVNSGEKLNRMQLWRLLFHHVRGLCGANFWNLEISPGLNYIQYPASCNPCMLQPLRHCVILHN